MSKASETRDEPSRWTLGAVAECEVGIGIGEGRATLTTVLVVCRVKVV